MYNTNNNWSYPYFAHAQLYNPHSIYKDKMCQCPCFPNMPMYNFNLCKPYLPQYIPYTDQCKGGMPIKLKDYGPEPFVVNIEEAAKQNNNFRTALWTGDHLQLTLT